MDFLTSIDSQLNISNRNLVRWEYQRNNILSLVKTSHITKLRKEQGGKIGKMFHFYKIHKHCTDFFLNLKTFACIIGRHMGRHFKNYLFTSFMGLFLSHSIPSLTQVFRICVVIFRKRVARFANTYAVKKSKAIPGITKMYRRSGILRSSKYLDHLQTTGIHFYWMVVF